MGAHVGGQAERGNGRAGQADEYSGKKLRDLLDLDAGIVYEGEDPPQWSADEVEAVEIAALVRTGSGGIDWQALPFVAGWLRVKDLDLLFRRLRVLLLHRPPPTES
jgi:hypothetical protein